MLFWALMSYATTRILGFLVFAHGGVIRQRVRVSQRLLMDRFNVYLASKAMFTEERHYYDEHNTTVLYTWDETSAARGASSRGS